MILTGLRRVSKRTMSIWILSVYVLLLVLLILSQIIIQTSQLKEIKSFVKDNINYDSQSSDESLSKVKKFNEENPTYDITSSVDISFLMKIYSINGYNDPFQTGLTNSGIRLDASGSTNDIKLGLVIGSSNNPQGGVGYSLHMPIKSNEEYKFRLIISNEKHIEVYLDNNLVLNEVNPSINFTLDNFAIGSGFSASRNFNGSINDFKVQYKLYKMPIIYNVAKNIFKYILICFAILTLILIMSFKEKTGKLYDRFRLNRKTSWLIGLATVIMVIGIYNLFLINRYFPMSEGWFSVYAERILQGKIPYKDFYLYLPPIYPLIMSGFIALFGKQFIALRIMGYFLIIFMACITYLIYCRIFPSLLSSLMAIFSIMYYQTDVTFIGYDFVQFLITFNLLSLLFIIKYLDNIYKNKNTKWTNIWLFISGFFSVLGLFIKQSNGLVSLIFLIIAFLVVVIRFDSKRFFNRAKWFSLGHLIPTAIICGWLYSENALKAFFIQCFIGGAQSKGSLGAIIFAWIPRLFDGQNVYFSIFLLILFLFIINEHNILFKLNVRNERSSNNKNTNVLGFLLILIISLICIILPYVNIKINNKFLYSHMVNLFNRSILLVVPLATFFLTIIYLIKILANFEDKNKNETENNLSKDVTYQLNDLYTLIILIVSTGLMLGTATSAAIGDMGVAFGLGQIFGLLIYNPKSKEFLPKYSKSLKEVFTCYPNIFQKFCSLVKGGSVLAIFLMLIFFTATKYTTPYYWWSLTQPDIRQANTKSNIKYLQGFRLSEQANSIISKVTDLINENTQRGDSIFTYPNIPVFYFLTNRWPDTFSLIQWFDVLPDSYAQSDARLLLQKPPKLIVFLQPPNQVYLAHEQLFRDGRKSGQRLFVDAINQLTSDNEKYELLYQTDVPTNYVLKIFKQIDGD